MYITEVKGKPHIVLPVRWVTSCSRWSLRSHEILARRRAEALRVDDGHLSNEHLAVSLRESAARGRQHGLLYSTAIVRRHFKYEQTPRVCLRRSCRYCSENFRHEVESWPGFAYVTSGSARWSVVMEIARNDATITHSSPFLLNDYRATERGVGVWSHAMLWPILQATSAHAAAIHTKSMTQHAVSDGQPL